MADFLTECISGFCGVCCVAISSAFTQWTYTSRVGANGCCCCSGRNAGCGCCNDKFNEDGFEEQVRKDIDKTRDPNAPAAKQPQVTPEMIVPSSGGEPQVQAEDRVNEEITAVKQMSEVAKDEKEKTPPLA